MDRKVSIPGVVVKGNLAGYAFYEDLRRQLEEGVKSYITLSVNEALDQEVDRLLGREAYERRDEKSRKRIGARCLGCHSRRQQDFVRNGHKRRGLVTLWGSDLDIWMPRLECQACGGTVHVEYETVPPRQRVWHDVREETREAAGLGQSLREIKGELDSRLRTSFGLRTLNAQLHRMAELVEGWRGAALEEVPPVLMLDALWMRVMRRNGHWRHDRKGRKRAVKGVTWQPIMVALGAWPGERRWRILDWEIGVGPGENAEGWIPLLTRLEERGIRGVKGLRLIIHDGGKGLDEALSEVHLGALQQRCLFHKLHNLVDAAFFAPEVKREEAQRVRRLILQEASAIWQAKGKEEARERQKAFCQRWAASQPEVVATLQRDFESTLTFYDLLAWAAQEGQKWPVVWLRTTSLLERLNRSYRRRLRQMVTAHSSIGLTATLYQVTARIQHAHSGAPLGWSTFIERLLWDQP